jgi:hypothetical protein
VNNVRLVILMLFCIAGGMLAGYKVALHKEHNRLECNKALVRMSHEKVWSERNSEPPLQVACEIYSNDFVPHDWTGDSTGGLATFAKGIAVTLTTFRINTLPVGVESPRPLSSDLVGGRCVKPCSCIPSSRAESLRVQIVGCASVGE